MFTIFIRAEGQQSLQPNGFFVRLGQGFRRRMGQGIERQWKIAPAMGSMRALENGHNAIERVCYPTGIYNHIFRNKRGGRHG